MWAKWLNTLENLTPCSDISLGFLNTPAGIWKNQERSNFSCGSTVHAGKPEGALWCIKQHLWAHVMPSIFLGTLLRMDRNMGMELSAFFVLNLSFVLLKDGSSFFPENSGGIPCSVIDEFLPFEKKEWHFEKRMSWGEWLSPLPILLKTQRSYPQHFCSHQKHPLSAMLNPKSHTESNVFVFAWDPWVTFATDGLMLRN